MKKISVSIFMAVFLILAYGIAESFAGGPLAKMHLSPKKLNFGTVPSGSSPSAQSFMINNTGGWTLDWYVTTNANWLACNPSSGINCGKVNVNVSSSGMMSGNYTATITVTSHYASNSPQTINVNLNVYAPETSSPPFGSFQTPFHNSTVRSSIPVTGWVLDDVGVNNVKIYRGEGTSQVYIGDAVFVEGARPDVAAAYPDYPNNYKAGWGYMMLTNFLPNGGNGTYTLQAIATDAEGKSTTLGKKTIYCDNANAVKPFGAIDTPTQGGAASGSNFINWGWALTPLPNHIPTDGSTISVYVDGVNKGHPCYNVRRHDIASLFPDYANSDGPGAYFPLDTTGYNDGVHTILWTATDNAGNTDGIGSRYFTINNTDGGSNLDFIEEPTVFMRGISDTQYPQLGDTQYDFGESDIIEIDLAGLFPPTSEGYIYFCFQKAGETEQNIPIGSTIDGDTFYWMPGPGIVGKYDLVFERLLFSGQREQVDVTVTKGALGYTLTVVNGTGSGEYKAGTVVSISANTPAAGQLFDRWTGDTACVADVNSATTTVTMPESDVTVTATYTAIPQPTLSVSPGNQDVARDDGSTSFSVSNTGTGTMNWTASVTSGSSWLSIQSGSSGTNSGTINVAFTKNTSTSSRTGTIRVTATGATGSPKDVTVTQAASEITDGYAVTSELWAKAILQVPGNPVTLIWQEVGRDITPIGDQVISGYFYADPNDFAYGSQYNPEVFVKIYIATNGWCNIAFNHVTVDDVTVYSAHNYSGTPDKTGSVSLTSRLAEHQYDGVGIDTGSGPGGGRSSLIGATATGGGYIINSGLWEKAVLQTPGGPVTLKWKEVGADNTPTGARVVSGYFYADPADFAYGSEYNPELFVKIYIDPNGWANIASNHVTVDNVDVSSSHNYSGTPDQSGIASLSNRLVEQQYTGVVIE